MLLDHRRFLAGDRHTVHVFYSAARKWTRRFVNDPILIESIVQRALLEMTDRLNAGEVPDSDALVLWICNCTNNVVRRELRRIHRWDDIEFESSVHGRSGVDMSHVLRIKLELELLERTMATLDARAVALFMDRVRGESYRQLASIYGLSEGAARQSVAKTRKQLMAEIVAQAKRDCLRRLATKFHGHRPSLSTESSSS